MEGLRLLERLRAMEQEPDNRGMLNMYAVKASVLEHLNALLNTRQGSAMISEDLGMPDFTSMLRSFDDMTFDELATDIQAVLEKYEPRLGRVRIEVLPQDKSLLKMKFKIQGRLQLRSGSSEITFETIVDPEGRIEIL